MTAPVPAQPPALDRDQARTLRVATWGFIVTGIVTTLLGPILPALAERWSLADVQSGALFAAQFVASTVGAGLAPLHLRRALLLGYAAIAIGVLALPFWGFTGALAALVIIGLGLGLGQTATNILVSAAYPSRRGASLSLVNLWWGVGAVLCPALVALFFRYGSLTGLIAAIAGAAALMTVLLGRLARRSVGTARPVQSGDAAPAGGPALFIFAGLLLFFYVGTETCVAGWVATYAGRIGSSRALSSLTPLLFWVALLVARGVVPLLLRTVSESALRRAGLLLAVWGALVLVLSRSLAGIGAGAALTGAGMGPVFPLSVSLFLARAGESRRRGLVFAFCGLGGAVLPWAMGYVSTQTASLRSGFLVPVAALGLMLLLTLLRQ